MSRSTTRTITCDRCGDTKPVKEWTQRELRVLRERGWSSYRSFTPDNDYAGRGSTKKDLCPDCTASMKSFMNQEPSPLISGRWVSSKDVADANGLMLTDLRTQINAELRRRRAK